MAHCAHKPCGRWRPDVLAVRGAGVHFDGSWYCGESCLRRATLARLDQVTAPEPLSTVRVLSRARLGAILLHQGAITRERLQVGLDQQARLSLRLGQALTVLGLATASDVLRALAAQAQVPYLTAIEPSRVEHAPGNFSPDAARALGVVPFEVEAIDEDRSRLKVACRAPLPRQTLTALREISGWSVEPYLVWDTEFSSLVAAYGRAKRTPRRERPVLKTTLDAADRIARSAIEGRAASMAWARCAPFVWVRLKGPEPQDLFVPVGAPRERSRAWQAVPTSH